MKNSLKKIASFNLIFNSFKEIKVLITKKWMHNKIKIFKTIGISAALTVTFFDKVMFIGPVDGCSMQPLFNVNGEDEDIILLWRLPVKLNNVNRGDVVVLISQDDPKQRIIKRVIGLPGDIVKTRTFKKNIVRIPPGHCWVEGDNKKKSYDSNSFGVIPMGLLVAKAGFIVYPFKRFKKISTEIPTDRLLQPLYTCSNEYQANFRIYDDDNHDDEEDVKLFLASNKNLVTKKPNMTSIMNYYIDLIKS